MKKLLLSLVALVAFSAVAQNNYWDPTLLINSESISTKTLTNGATAATYNGMTNTFDLVGKELGLQINIAPQTWSANQSNLVVLVSKSIDGVKFTPLSANTVSLTANLTAATTITTNITLNSVRKVKVAVYTDAIYGSGLTNFQVYATSK